MFFIQKDFVKLFWQSFLQQLKAAFTYLIHLAAEEASNPEYMEEGVDRNPSDPGRRLKDLVQHASNAVIVKHKRTVCRPI